MSLLISAVVALALTGAEQAAPASPQTAAPQTAPRSASDLTRDLNAAPAASTAQPAPRPAAPPAAAPTTAAPATSTPRPATSTSSTGAPTTAAPATAAPATSAPAAATPRPAPAAASPAAEAPAAEAPAPALVPLNAAAIAALPFSLTLPQGFEIVQRPSGPDAKVYSVRKGEQTYAMIYAGPSSQFPIYDGEQVRAGGRLSVVVAEGTTRRAREHLFERPTAPREIHIWTMSLDGGDRALAEMIAGSLDVR